MSRNGSASSAERTLACPAWLSFPHVRRTSPAAARGTGLQAFITRVVAGTPPADALELVSEADRPTAALIDWSRLLGGLSDVRAEAAYALDVRARTARFLGYDVGRKYEEAALAHGGPLGEWEVPGSLDLTGVDGANRVAVIDVKSGFRDVTPAETNGQLMFYAACRMLVDGVDEVEVRIAKLKTSGAVYDGDRAVVERFDAEEWLSEYATALGYAKAAQLGYAQGVVPDVAEGDQCHFCPAFDACPAKHALARSALGTLAAIDARVAAMTLDEVGAAYEIAKERIEPVLDRVVKALRERVLRDGRAPLPGGLKEVRPLSFPKAAFSQTLARGLLVQLGATDDQIARCYETKNVEQVRILNVPGVKKSRPKRGKSVSVAEIVESTATAEPEIPFR